MIARKADAKYDALQKTSREIFLYKKNPIKIAKNGFVYFIEDRIGITELSEIAVTLAIK